MFMLYVDNYMNRCLIYYLLLLVTLQISGSLAIPQQSQTTPLARLLEPNKRERLQEREIFFSLPINHRLLKFIDTLFFFNLGGDSF